MDVGKFTTGKWLGHQDLPQDQQTWTITGADEQMVGETLKCVVYFHEHEKGLGLNKTNVRRLVELWGDEANEWTGKRVYVYRSVCDYQGTPTLCVRLCGPLQAPPDAICDKQKNMVPRTPLPAAKPLAEQERPETKGDIPF